MFIQGRSSRVFAPVFALAALGACGGSDTSSPASVPAADSVVDASIDTAPVETPVAELGECTIVSGDTLSGIASRADVSLDALIDVNAWADGADHLISPGDIIALPAGATIAAAPTTAAPDASTPATSASTAPATSSEYGTATFDFDFDGESTTPVAVPLVDGLYYASSASANGSAITLTLGQWFTCGDSGVASDPTVECGGGIGVLDSPSATVSVAADAQISVNTGDLSNFERAAVGVDEFARLLNGEAPAAGAPAGYSFVPWSIFTRIENGVAVEVMQIYTS